ncbi:MAG: hypothetical protein LWY06_00340, partial [Firmicutes bacterium]|nr:hypothetical protein [Bacillota bacterium]
NKDSRYLLPLTPLTATFTVFWIDAIKHKFLKMALLTVLLIASFCSSSLWILPKFESLMKDKRDFVFFSIPPDKTNWNLDKVSDVVDQLVDSDKTMVIVKGGEKAQVSDSAFAYEIISKYPASASIQRGEEWEKIIQVQTYNPSGTVIIDIKGTENEEHGDYLNFIIISVDKSPWEKDIPYYLAEKLQKIYDAKNFRNIKNVSLADGWIAHIYSLKRDDRNDD